MSSVSLDLDDLHARHPGVTPASAASYCEAARVCLDRHHDSPIVFVIEHEAEEARGHAQWLAADERTRRAWANDTDATEAAAYCIALAAVEASAGLVAVGRAENFVGADFYVAPAGDDPNDLENRLRLEVSGVDRGGISDIKARLRQKILQVARGRSDVPAVAVVVGFLARTILAKRV